MPYLSCSKCRLTVYSPPAWVYRAECPRCEGSLGDPKRLFDAAPPYLSTRAQAVRRPDRAA
jgi:hypothetical protein